MKIGLVTIGQSPRPDLLRSMQQTVGDSTKLTLTGALDDLDNSEIHRLAPKDRDEPLVTLTRTGHSVTISKQRIVPLMQQRINEHQESGRDLIVVLCTGAFPELSARVPLLMPDRIIHHFVKGVLPSGKLGIIVPTANQKSMMRGKWGDFPDCTVDFLNPYGNADFSRHDPRLSDCGLVVLDCMGYTNETKSAVRAHLDAPIIVAQEVLASAVSHLI